jgi:hypothetical protein
VTPEAQAQPVSVHVHSGNTSFDSPPLAVVERPGRWYFPPIAALITAGGRLLLAMLERCVRDAGGTYLFCDTDSLCIVASPSPRPVRYECEGRVETVPVISRHSVNEISARFASLNPHDRRFVLTAVIDWTAPELHHLLSDAKHARLTPRTLLRSGSSLFPCD